MSLTNDQLLERVEALEKSVDDLQTALTNVAAKKTVNALAGLRQKEVDDLKNRVSILESAIVILQSKT